MEKLKVTKKALKIVTSYGSGVIFHEILRNNVHPTRIDKKIAMRVAAYFMGGLIANVVCDNVDKVVDGWIAEFKNAGGRIKKAWDEAEVEVEVDNKTDETIEPYSEADIQIADAFAKRRAELDDKSELDETDSK